MDGARRTGVTDMDPWPLEKDVPQFAQSMNPDGPELNVPEPETVVIRKLSGRLLRAAIKRWKLRRPGRSQQMFANLLGVDRKSLNNWCAGRTKPDANQLLAIMAYTGHTLESLSVVSS